MQSYTCTYIHVQYILYKRNQSLQSSNLRCIVHGSPSCGVQCPHVTATLHQGVHCIQTARLRRGWGGREGGRGGGGESEGVREGGTEGAGREGGREGGKVGGEIKGVREGGKEGGISNTCIHVHVPSDQARTELHVL